jgi:hypothetical protein
MKVDRNKLTLRAHSIRTLTASELRDAAGGVWPTGWPTGCRCSRMTTKN